MFSAYFVIAAAIWCVIAALLYTALWAAARHERAPQSKVRPGQRWRRGPDILVDVEGVNRHGVVLSRRDERGTTRWQESFAQFDAARGQLLLERISGWSNWDAPQ